jgi:hypothetical protein
MIPVYTYILIYIYTYILIYIYNYIYITYGYDMAITCAL